MGIVKLPGGRKANPVARAFARCAAGALFLLNPNFHLIDLLPDAIGYLLIVLGLRAIEPVSPSIEEARARFSMLLRVSVVRITALPLTFVVGYDEKTFILVFTFAFALVETIYLLPAFHYLYDGTSYLALRYGSAPAKTKPPRIISAVFAVGRAALNVLPELQYLPMQYEEDLGLNPTYQPFRLSQLSHMLILVNIVFTLLLATIWVIRFRGYLKRLRRDSALDESMTAELAAQPRDAGAELLRRLKPALSLITVAMFACLDFYADGYNLIPDVISALLLLAAAMYLYRAKECTRTLPAIASVYTGLTAVLGVLNYVYAGKYYAFATVKQPDALRVQAVQTIYAGVCSAVFVALMCMLCLALIGVTSRHAGLFAEPEFRTKNAKTQRERLRVRNMLWACFVLAVIAEGASAVYGALVIKHSVLWMPAAALTMALGALTAVTTGNLYYQTELRHGKNNF
jgi:hypothetical protein